MKKNLCRFMALALSIAVVASTSACAGQQIPMHTAADAIRINKQDPYKRGYKVTFKEGETYAVESDDITAKGDLIGVRMNEESDYRYYSVDQIREISAKRKSHWAIGGGIGAGVGLAASLASAFLSKPNCENAGDASDCRGMHKAASIIAVPVLTGAGFGIGAAIGSAVKRKKKRTTTINIAPKVYGTGQFKVNGGGIGVSGSF